MLRRLVGICVVIGLAASASAQATRPSPPAWSKAVGDFAAALTAGDLDASRALTTPDCNIHTFQIDRPTGMRQLLDFATAETMLGSHAYAQPAINLANDIADDVAKSDIVPPEAKKSLVVDDLDSQTKATATALRWISTTLKSEDGSLVGVVVLWDTNAVATADNPAHPLFILVKGAANDAGECTITKVVYGDPLQN